MVNRRAHLLDCLALFLHTWYWGFPLAGVLDVALVQGKLPIRVLHQPGIVPGSIDLTAPAPGLTAVQLRSWACPVTLPWTTDDFKIEGVISTLPVMAVAHCLVDECP